MKSSFTLHHVARALLTLAVCLGTAAHAGSKNLDSDVDALGGNDDLMERANAINPNNSTRIVQKRAVDLDDRFEFVLTDGLVVGGDPYVNSNDLGGQVEFHFNPQWSLGARYYQISNSLTSEGQNVINNINTIRQTDPNIPSPVIDYAKNTYFGTITYAPFYGKLNLADLAVTQFDIYFVGGYGAIDLQSGTAGTYTAGAGMAFWISNHFSARLEARYQGYRAVYPDQMSEQVNMTILSLGIGFLL